MLKSKSNKWAVAWKDRGMGHGDYGILDEKGVLVVEVKTGMKTDADLIVAAHNMVEDYLTDYSTAVKKLSKRGKVKKGEI